MEDKFKEYRKLSNIWFTWILIALGMVLLHLLSSVIDS